MNPLTDLLFTLSWFILLVWALRTMARGWGMILQPRSNDLKMDVSTKQITRPPHPELQDVKPGDELLVVNFTPDDEFNRKVTDGILSKSLKDRIDELDDPWEDDDDDDGDVPAVVRR